MKVEWGLVRERHVPDRLDVVMFSAAAAAIMHCYSDGHGRHRDVFRSKYLNYLDFVFGSEGAIGGISARPRQRAVSALSSWPQLSTPVSSLGLRKTLIYASKHFCRYQPVIRNSVKHR